MKIKVKYYDKQRGLSDDELWAIKNLGLRVFSGFEVIGETLYKIRYIGGSNE